MKKKKNWYMLWSLNLFLEIEELKSYTFSLRNTLKAKTKPTLSHSNLKIRTERRTNAEWNGDFTFADAGLNGTMEEVENRNKKKMRETQTTAVLWCCCSGSFVTNISIFNFNFHFQGASSSSFNFDFQPFLANQFRFWFLSSSSSVFNFDYGLCLICRSCSFRSIFGLYMLRLCSIFGMFDFCSCVMLKKGEEDEKREDKIMCLWWRKNYVFMVSYLY